MTACVLRSAGALALALLALPASAAAGDWSWSLTPYGRATDVGVDVELSDRFTGGRTRVGGLESDDLQRNSRIGATLFVPFAPGHAVKLAGTTSVVTERGGDFHTLEVAYQRAWR